MAKAFSVASWNVKHFGSKSKNSSSPKKAVGPVIDFLVEQKADVFAIYEVVGKHVFKEMVTKMPSHQFHITEGPQSQEILIGVSRKLTSFFTQKVEFKSGANTLRPGALLTIVIDTVPYPVLFLHLKSMTDPKGHGLRDDMFKKAFKLRKKLDGAHSEQGLSGRSNFIFLGDLNTMGMNITYSDKDISAREEIERLEVLLARPSVEMTIQAKTEPVTWWPGSNASYPVGNLDHVVCADHLKLKSFGDATVDVRGWVSKTTDKGKDAWVKKYSDHALLYFEVQKAN